MVSRGGHPCRLRPAATSGWLGSRCGEVLALSRPYGPCANLWPVVLTGGGAVLPKISPLSRSLHRIRDHFGVYAGFRGYCMRRVIFNQKGGVGKSRDRK